MPYVNQRVYADAKGIQSIAEQEEYKRIEENDARRMLEQIAHQEKERNALQIEGEDLRERIKELRCKKVAVEAELTQLNFDLEKVAKLKSQKGV